MQLGQLIEVVSGQALTKEDRLSLDDYRKLSILAWMPDHMLHMGELARVMGGSRGQLSIVIERYEIRGWIERVPCPRDGRAVHVQLTAKGSELVRDAGSTLASMVHKVGLTDFTIMQLRDILRFTEKVMIMLAEFK